MVQNGPASGTANLTTNTITSTANVTLKITKLTIFGLSGGGPLSGTYTIPAFHDCGLNTVLLNLTIPGSGNTISLTLGQLQLT